MRAIDKFILHVVHNWKNELNEAYSESAVKAFIKKFSEEADDLNLNISEDQLRKYIERFDNLKNSPKITEKDLDKYNIGQLVRLVTSSPGAETAEDEEDQTPDVVFPKPNDPIPSEREPGYNITIWNGSKEGNCITYGRGERWCITRGSFGTYRFDASKGYPTFYLAKNTNISDSDKLSFVAIQVRDVDDENRKYVYTNRQNSPFESKPMSFSALMSEIPWLNDIPNIRSILRYIPLSSKEQITQKYRGNNISIREWNKLPFNIKKQYLVVRKGKELFNDIEDTDFVSSVLPKYPQLAEFIAITPDILKPELLLRHLDKFNNQDRRSITANIQTPIDIKYLSTDLFPFDVKKLLTVLKKWNLPSTDRMYITKDGEAIVKLKFGNIISVGVYTAEDDYPNIKLNQRTSKYLLDYPELDKLPFNSLLKLATDGIVNKEFIDKVIEKAKSEENSAIIVKKVEDGEILVDANSFSSYKIQDGKITKVPFTDEEVQKVLGAEKDNTAFQQGVVNIIKDSTSNYENIPLTIDKDAFISIINSTPYNNRTFNATRGGVNGEQVILVPEGENSNTSLFTRTVGNNGLYTFNYGMGYGGEDEDWGSRNSGRPMNEAEWRAYFAYLRNENIVYEGSRLQQWFRDGYSTNAKRAWFIAQPPISPTDRYAVATGANGINYVINKANPRESLKLSDSGKLVKANIPAAMARQLTGATPDEATPAAQFGAGQAVAAPLRTGRGRPAGVPNAPRAAAPAAPAAAGDINVAEEMDNIGILAAFNALPRNDRNRLNVTTGRRVAPNGDRGAARRNNQLGAAGSVGRVIEVPSTANNNPCKIYIIRLANQQIIASINIQPGNRNYILLPNGTMVTLNSPAELMQALRQRNLAEAHQYIVREYIANNPHHLDEVKSLLRKHIAETKKS
jgi:hypothetical protein